MKIKKKKNVESESNTQKTVELLTKKEQENLPWYILILYKILSYFGTKRGSPVHFYIGILILILVFPIVASVYIYVSNFLAERAKIDAARSSSNSLISPTPSNIIPTIKNIKSSETHFDQNEWNISLRQFEIRSDNWICAKQTKPYFGFSIMWFKKQSVLVNHYIELETKLRNELNSNLPPTLILIYGLDRGSLGRPVIYFRNHYFDGSAFDVVRLYTNVPDVNSGKDQINYYNRPNFEFPINISQEINYENESPDMIEIVTDLKFMEQDDKIITIPFQDRILNAKVMDISSPDLMAYVGLGIHNGTCIFPINFSLFDGISITSR